MRTCSCREQRSNTGYTRGLLRYGETGNFVIRVLSVYRETSESIKLKPVMSLNISVTSVKEIEARRNGRIREKIPAKREKNKY